MRSSSHNGFGPSPGQTLAGAMLVVAALTVTATLATSCDRLNPDWCETHAMCGPNEHCDPASNTCVARDLGQLDGPLDQRLDHAVDQAPDRPAVDLIHKPDRGIDLGRDLSKSEVAPPEGGAD